MGGIATMRLFAYHENVESVAALLDALSRRIEVHAFRVVSPSWYLRARRGLQGGYFWDQVAGAAHQSVTLVPGVRRFPRPSKVMLQRSYQAAVRKHGVPDLLLVDSPYLEPFASTIDRPLIYVAADAYRFYDWDHERTEALERHLLTRAQASFPVSELLADEFRERGARAVFQSPTAVGADFMAASSAQTPAPLDMAGVGRPRVGVVGKINATYDWTLIESLAEARPGISFVFIGPEQEPEPANRARIHRAFARPNVHWLGEHPHVDLPSYLNACDVLLNPLRVTDHNDRRFPLRLCEYLTTDRPVLTTAIHETKWFAPHVVPFADAEEALSALDAAVAGDIAVDVEGRRDWLGRNSWDVRADQVLAALEQTGGGPR